MQTKAVDSRRHGNFLWLLPIPKGNKHESPSNYRPISLLSVASKLLERHFHQWITDHLSDNHPFASTQWGFQPVKSTVSALLSTTYNWLEEMEAGRDICWIHYLTYFQISLCCVSWRPHDKAGCEPQKFHCKCHAWTISSTARTQLEPLWLLCSSQFQCGTCPCVAIVADPIG